MHYLCKENKKKYFFISLGIDLTCVLNVGSVTNIGQLNIWLKSNCTNGTLNVSTSKEMSNFGWSVFSAHVGLCRTSVDTDKWHKIAITPSPLAFRRASIVFNYQHDTGASSITKPQLCLWPFRIFTTIIHLWPSFLLVKFRGFIIFLCNLVDVAK